MMARKRWAGGAVLPGLLLLAAAGCRDTKGEPRAPGNEQPAVIIAERLGRSVRLEATPPHHVVEVNLAGAGVTDADLNELKELKRLRYLILNGGPVTDAGMRQLKDLPE